MGIRQWEYDVYYRDYDTTILYCLTDIKAIYTVSYVYALHGRRVSRSPTRATQTVEILQVKSVADAFVRANHISALGVYSTFVAIYRICALVDICGCVMHCIIQI